MDTDKLNEIGFADWNKKSLDELVQHLEREFCYQSTGTAKAIFTLIEYYHKTKQLNKPLVMQGLTDLELLKVLHDVNRNRMSVTNAMHKIKVSPSVGKAGGDASVSDGK